jgi:hypothetical protein
MRKKIFVYFIVEVLIIVAVECALRLFWGFGTPVLYTEDKDFEYIYSANQDVKRFGNHILTNEYSMRSKPLSKTDDIRILKIGDSVINGGTPTDQDSLASTLLENQLSEEYHKNIRVLNISAGSWGPDNAAAYIKKYGNFECKMMVLVFSSHDLYDNMEHEKIVGLNVNYPDKKPFCAIMEVLNRYLIPRIQEKFSLGAYAPSKLNPDMIGTRVLEINPGWQFFIEHCRKNNIALFVVLHPTTMEIEQNSYNENGKKIIALLDSSHVDYLKELDNHPAEDLYRDNIHYNARGQRFLAKEEHPEIKKFLDSYYKEHAGSKR